MKKMLYLCLLVFLSFQPIFAAKGDSLCFHKIVRDNNGFLLSWYQPETDGAAFTHVAKLATDFIKTKCPVEPKTGKPLYYLFCEFPHPSTDDNFFSGTVARYTLPNNPACVFAGLTQSLAVDYYPFYGDDSVLQIVQDILDHMIEYGTTPVDWKWGSCPYASSDPGETVYAGGTQWQDEGRGDGPGILEPDKIGEMGVAYLQFYQMTENKKYLDAAVACASALAKNVIKGDIHKSPWPYRVNGKTGEDVESYCSNVLPPIMLFDDLDRIKDYIDVSPVQLENFQKAREVAWNWLFSKSGPMKTFIWKGYFEDCPIDDDNSNRVQVTAIETARYLLQHPEYDPFYKENVSALLKWSDSVFGTDGSMGYNAQCEQLICYQPMGSHTARYASVCAMWYAKTGIEAYKTEALENFNWATYCCDNDGIVSVGPRWLGAWFSDGYGDYIKHFFDGMQAVPEWAPAGENHLLGSSSLVQSIKYENAEIQYRTYLPNSIETLKLNKQPQAVTVDGKPLAMLTEPGNGWTWQPCGNDGVVRIKHSNGREVRIMF